MVSEFPGDGFQFGTKAGNSGAKCQRTGTNLIPAKSITVLSPPSGADQLQRQTHNNGAGKQVLGKRQAMLASYTTGNSCRYAIIVKSPKAPPYDDRNSNFCWISRIGRVVG